MLPLNLWEHQSIVKTFYSKCVEGVCKKHNLTRMELDILLFLANNPCFDTASDIVNIRYLSKSQVSASIKTLEEKGLLQKKYQKGNRKTVHLHICDTAEEILLDGRNAQEHFLEWMFTGIPYKDLEVMKYCIDRMLENIDRWMKFGEEIPKKEGTEEKNIEEKMEERKREYHV